MSIGSFWEGTPSSSPGQQPDHWGLLEKEERDLRRDLELLPKNAVLRRINELTKRGRLVKVHAYLLHYLRKKMPKLWGGSAKQELLMEQLPRRYKECSRRYGLSSGDFPNMRRFQEAMRDIRDLRSFPKIDKSAVKSLDLLFSTDIPALLEGAMRERRTFPAMYPWAQ